MKNIFAVLFLFLIISACGRKNDKEGSENNSNDSTQASATQPKEGSHVFSPEKPFKDEKGMIKYEYSGDYKGTQTRYWKDYGRMQRIEDEYTNLNSPTGAKVKQTIIIRPNEYIFIDMLNNNGYKVNLTDTSSEFRDNMMADFALMGIDSTMRKNGYRDNGQLTISDKKCVVYKNGESEFCFWNGMNIKTDMSLGSVRYNLNAVEIDDDPKVKDELFEAPSDIKLPDYDDYVKQTTRGKL